MLVLKKKFNVSIAESAAYPLAYPSTEDLKLMKDQVPYVVGYYLHTIER